MDLEMRVCSPPLYCEHVLQHVLSLPLVLMLRRSVADQIGVNPVPAQGPWSKAMEPLVVALFLGCILLQLGLQGSCLALCNADLFSTESTRDPVIHPKFCSGMIDRLQVLIPSIEYCN